MVIPMRISASVMTMRVPKRAARNPPDNGHGQIADEIAGSQKSQLRVVKLKPFFHGRQDNGIGHAAETMGGNGGLRAP